MKFLDFGFISFKKMTLIIWTEDGGLWSLKKSRHCLSKLEVSWSEGNRALVAGQTDPQGNTHTHARARARTHTHDVDQVTSDL